jgi:peptide/nickel transport system substrate-binding protein
VREELKQRRAISVSVLTSMLLLALGFRIQLAISSTPVHDVCIYRVTLSDTVVARGDPLPIKVTVRNEGDLAETFNVTALCGNSSLGTRIVTNLPSREYTTLTFIWDTTGVDRGTYPIWAVASVVPGEIDTTDNQYMAGNVQIIGLITVPDDYATIQEAINAASPGDTVHVRAGLYSPPFVTVNKTISLVGEGADVTIIEFTTGCIGVWVNDVNITGLTISGDIESSAPGIYLYGVSGCRIFENVIRDNEDGIKMDYCSNNFVYANSITENWRGMSLYVSNSNTIHSNQMIHNIDDGILFTNSSNNAIYKNNITNSICGVELWYSIGNRFYHNNFLDNNENADIATSGDTDFWDNGYASWGNYWSDYDGNDNNLDGVGDSSYVIDEHNQDDYPLMEPWSTPENETIVIGTVHDYAILDPADATYYSYMDLFENTGEGLLKYRPGTTELMPGIAENYDVSPDGRNYTFTLRPDLYFTDGDPLDAAAVKWSVERAMRINLSSWLFSDIVDRVEVVDSLHVRFVLKGAFSFFPSLVIMSPYFPVSSNSFPDDATGTCTVGLYGPYKIKSWTEDVELVLEANPDYYGEQPKSKYVIVKFYETSTALRQALENGTVDIAWRLNPADTVILEDNPDINHFEALGYGRYLVMRCNMTPFDDVRVREAVAAAINRTRLCTGPYMDTADPLYSLVPMDVWSHIDAYKDEYGVRNLPLAMALLNAAGYDESNKLQFEYWYANNEYQAGVAAVVKSDLEETDMVNVTLKCVSINSWTGNITTGNMPMFHLGAVQDYIDPSGILPYFLHSAKSPEMGVFYSNASMDAILDEAEIEQNMTRRMQLYEDIQRLAAEETPVVPLFQGKIYAFTKHNIRGVCLSQTNLLPYYTIYRQEGSTRYPWSMFHHDLEHSGYSESPAPNTNQTLWNYTTGGGVESSPAVVDGRVYVGSNYGDNGRVYCLDAFTGAHIWNYTTGNAVYSSPAVVDGRVYVGSDDHKVYCLDAFTGAEIWYYETGYRVDSSPAVADGKVYVSSEDGKVYCLDALTGAHIWNYTIGPYWMRSSPAVVGGRVYVGSGNGKVYCLNALTGIHIWNYTIGGRVFSSLAVVDGRVYVGSDNGRVYCLDALTGTGIWNYEMGEMVQTSPTVANGKVYVAQSYDSDVYCLDALTGAYIWNYTTGPVFSSPAVADGKVYVGSNDFKVYCLDALTGGLIWNYATGGPVESSPAVADGVVFVGSDDGTVYAFGNVVRVSENVQEAINEAPTGTTLIIAPKVYYESLVINKPLTIIGEMGSAPIFDGGGSGIAVIILSSASGSTIAGIVITNWDQGILINDSSNCKIYGNIMSLMGTTGIGIEGTNAANNQIYSNIFQDNAIAISLFASSAPNVIYKNIITSNNVGLSLQSNGNTVYANIISENNAGIDVSSSSNNVIYHNNFANYIQNVIIGGSHNVWDNGYPAGGNFWSSYTGADIYHGQYQNEAGSDGIVDTQYPIAVNNVDRYPLTKPFNPHDIGIANLFISKTVVGQGFPLIIEVKLLNYGVYDETFTLTVYANATPVAVQTIALIKKSSGTIVFTLDTHSIAKGNYIISAYAWPVQDEKDTADNTCTGGTVKVGIPGDVNPVDGYVGIDDIFNMARHFGHEPPGWDPILDPNYDINGDNYVGIDDIFIAASHFGEEYP